MNRPRKKLKEVNVAILSAYLYENLEGMIANAPTREWAVAQIRDFKYDPDNLSQTNEFSTRKFKVQLVKAENEGLFMKTDSFYECLFNPQSILALSGSSPEVENSIFEERNRGLIVARYSIFYGRPSKYTGRTPAESGYALDMPKDVSTVRALLSYDPLLDALVERDEKAIEKSLKCLNKKLVQPILTTPFLHETLNNERKRYVQ